MPYSSAEFLYFIEVYIVSVSDLPGLVNIAHKVVSAVFQTIYQHFGGILITAGCGRLKVFDSLCIVSVAAYTVSVEVAEKLAAFRTFRAVCGNCDGGDLRLMYRELNRFKIEDVDVLIKHIGGYPGNYDPSVRSTLYASPPQLFVAGHSHILKVKYDKTLNLLHINPGAAGIQGWHKDRTLVRLTIDGKEFKDLEVITLGD